MMKIILVLTVLLFSIPSNAHDLKTAFFQIYEIDEQCFIQVKLDRNDLEKALMAECNVHKVLDEAVIQSSVMNYLDDRLSISMDGQSTNLNYYEVTMDEDYFVVQGVFEGFNACVPIKKIAVRNTCLVDQVSGHNNIIQLTINDKKRSFRLNEDRVTTTIKY
ncbi:MAG: hypothetical protein OCD76_12685 [Reichenbachiella sp.]